MKRRIRSLAPLALAAAALVAGVVAAQAPGAPSNPWRQCCGMAPWPSPPGGSGPGMMSPGMTGQGGMGPGMMGQGGSMPRHRLAMMSGVPAPYAGLTNPLPRTRATLDLGAEVYAAQCAACHGTTGLGDGPAGRGLTPPPQNLAWLAQMPMAHWDPYMFWTVSEGGAPVGSAMPAFKDTLSEKDRWAVVAYIQARLPPPSQR